MTKEEYRELEILLGGLQLVGLAKSTEKRLEKSLQVIQRDKELLINGVVLQSEQFPTGYTKCNCSNEKDRIDCGFECYNK